MKNITVLDRQSLLDVAVQHCGAFETAFDIAQTNDLALTDDLAVGNNLKTPDPTDKDVVAYYAVNGLRPATAIEPEVEQPEQPTVEPELPVEPEPEPEPTEEPTDEPEPAPIDEAEVEHDLIPE